MACFHTDNSSPISPAPPGRSKYFLTSDLMRCGFLRKPLHKTRRLGHETVQSCVGSGGNRTRQQVWQETGREITWSLKTHRRQRSPSPRGFLPMTDSGGTPRKMSVFLAAVAKALNHRLGKGNEIRAVCSPINSS